MIGYIMKNSEGKYLAMDGGVTTDWFKASKFDKEGIKHRQMYLECGYKLYKFEIKDLGKEQPKPCGEYCNSEFEISIEQKGIFTQCTKCSSKSKLVPNIFEGDDE